LRRIKSPSIRNKIVSSVDLNCVADTGKAKPMGREATCECQWGGQTGTCKVLLETHELILRGPIRRKAPISSLTQITVHGDQLRFLAGQDQVTLNLGANLAQSWTRRLTAPPPSLAAKLGISTETRLVLIGECDDDTLRAAIAGPAPAAGKPANLILASVRTIADLNYALDVYSTLQTNPPIWIIYPKGPGKPLRENDVRNTLRSEGFIDTKVASVSAALTALRFLKRA
jgi:hypothetical protein